MQQTKILSQIKFNKNKVLFDNLFVKLDLTDMNETFGDWLKFLREQCKYSQQELADRSGVSKATISLLEKNKIASPRFDGLERIAKALGISNEVMRRNFAEKFVLNGFDSESQEVLDSIHIVFQDRRKVSKKQQEEILNAARHIARGVLAQKEE